MTPTSQVIKFAESLPNTIIDDVMMFVLMYGLDHDTMEPNTYIPTLKRMLEESVGMKHMSVLIRIISAFDFILWRDLRNIDSAEGMISRNADKLSADLVARQKASYLMKRRHHEKALSDWRHLRENQLTFDKLLEYESKLLL